jgi:hypothetical protein
MRPKPNWKNQPTAFILLREACTTLLPGGDYSKPLWRRNVWYCDAHPLLDREPRMFYDGRLIFTPQ